MQRGRLREDHSLIEHQSQGLARPIACVSPWISEVDPDVLTLEMGKTKRVCPGPSARSSDLVSLTPTLVPTPLTKVGQVSPKKQSPGPVSPQAWW